MPGLHTSKAVHHRRVVAAAQRVADLRIAHIGPALADQPHGELARPGDLARPALSLQSLDGNVRDLDEEVVGAIGTAEIP